MNRYRLNQILEILLFPVSDSEQGREDCILRCYETYRAFAKECEKGGSNRANRQKKNREYLNAKKELVSCLMRRNHGRIKSEDDIQLLYEMYYPMDAIEKEMERLESIRRHQGYESVSQENINVFYLSNLKRIALSLITYRDGVAAIRQWTNEQELGIETDIFGSQSVFNKIEIWNLLCRFTSPDLYIVIAAIENGQGIESLYEQKAHIMLADKLLVKSLQKGIAENHLHFHVGYDYETLWLVHMDLKLIEEKQERKWGREAYARLELALFRCLASFFLMQEVKEQTFGHWMQQTGYYELEKIIFKLYHGEYDVSITNECYEQIYNLYKDVRLPQSIYPYDYLLDKVYSEYVEYKTSSEFLFLYKSYQYIKENEVDTFFARLFVQYIRLKNEAFRNMNEQNVVQGLKYFQRKYDVARGAMGEGVLPAEDMMLEVFHSQMKICNLRKLEIRVAPWVDETDFGQMDYFKMRKRILPQLNEQIVLILNAYKRFILECVVGVRATHKILQSQKKQLEYADKILQQVKVRIVEQQPNIPMLGIVMHFLKTEELENTLGGYCWRNVAEAQSRDSSSKIYKRLFFRNVALAIEELRERIPRLSEYIVGIDAASDENAMEPWMFAPAYKMIRSHNYTRPVAKWKTKELSFERIQNIGFTYHVGEDFRHVLSGLRHIDEVVENFGYKPGDRLGHALVLGTDIELWVDSNEVVPIPLLEHMENLLWVWGVNVHEGLNLGIQLEVLEDQILNIAQKIYLNTENITVKMLYGAYKKKFDVDHKRIFQKILCEEGKTAYTFCQYAEMMQECQKMCAEDKLFDTRCCPMLQETEEQKPLLIVKKCNESYQGWSVDKLLSTNYCPVFEERAEKKELISVRREDIVLYKKLQEYLINKVEQKGSYVEANPTSNLIIGDFSNIQKHPIFYLNQRFQEGKHRALITINSDNPAVFNTNVENELAYIYYAAEAKGYAKSELLEWIDQIRQYGMDASFIQKEKAPEVIFSEVEEMLSALNQFDV